MSSSSSSGNSTAPNLDLLRRIVREAVDPNTYHVDRIAIRYSLAHGFRLLTLRGNRIRVRINSLMAQLRHCSPFPIDVYAQQRSLGKDRNAVWSIMWWESGLSDSVFVSSPSSSSSSDSASCVAPPSPHQPPLNELTITRLLRDAGWTAIEPMDRDSRTEITVYRDSGHITVVSKAGWTITHSTSSHPVVQHDVDLVVSASIAGVEFNVPPSMGLTLT